MDEHEFYLIQRIHRKSRKFIPTKNEKMEAILEKSSGHIRKQRSRPSNIAEFEKWEAKQKGDWNYEFYYGRIIKKGGMKQLEAMLASILLKCFWISALKDSGILYQETDIWIDENRKRVADLAYFDNIQIEAMATGKKQVPAFVIELLSKNDMLQEIEEKLQDYFDVGVQLVWYISPKFKKIYAYTSNNEVQIYTAGSVVTAAPVLPDFMVEIDKLFTIA